MAATRVIIISGSSVEPLDPVGFFLKLRSRDGLFSHRMRAPLSVLSARGGGIVAEIQVAVDVAIEIERTRHGTIQVEDEEEEVKARPSMSLHSHPWLVTRQTQKAGTVRTGEQEADKKPTFKKQKKKHGIEGMRGGKGLAGGICPVGDMLDERSSARCPCQGKNTTLVKNMSATLWHSSQWQCDLGCMCVPYQCCAIFFCFVWEGEDLDFYLKPLVVVG